MNLGYNGFPMKVVYGTIGAGTVSAGLPPIDALARANYDLQLSTHPLATNYVLYWDSSAIAGQSTKPKAQILFHELDHFLDIALNPSNTSDRRLPYQSNDYGFPSGTPPTATVSIGGDTFTYTFTSWWSQYDHAQVHNEIVSAYGSDQTAALEEAVLNIRMLIRVGKRRLA